MKKLAIVLLLICLCVAGCTEQEKDCQDVQVRQAVTKWSKELDKRLDGIENNITYLRKIVEPEVFLDDGPLEGMIRNVPCENGEDCMEVFTGTKWVAVHGELIMSTENSEVPK